MAGPTVDAGANVSLSLIGLPDKDRTTSRTGCDRRGCRVRFRFVHSKHEYEADHRDGITSLETSRAWPDEQFSHAVQEAWLMDQHCLAGWRR